MGADFLTREEFERQCLQAIACQNSGSFVPFAMQGGLASAQIVIIHTGQVIMYQRVGVDAFNRQRRLKCGRLGDIMQSCALENEEAAQHLAATQGVKHRLMQQICLRQAVFHMDGYSRLRLQ